MQHDLVQLTKITAHQLRSRTRDILMGSAMEAVAPDPIPLSKITRYRVRRSCSRQGAEECRIEDRNMRYIEFCAGSLNARHHARIVQRCKRNQVLDLSEHGVVD